MQRRFSSGRVAGSLPAALPLLGALALAPLALSCSDWNPGVPSDAPKGWYHQTQSLWNGLLAVPFPTPGTGTAVGSHGTIVHTTDGGATWVHQASGTTRDLLSASLVDRWTAVVVGELGTILRTDDGGLTWSTQWDGTGYDLNAVSFVDSEHGTAALLGGTRAAAPTRPCTP